METTMTTETNTLIAASNLHKIYAAGDVEVRALDGVSLTVERGEFVAIMGTSGSGKSTLMNILGCLDRPSAGFYQLAGHEVSQLSRDQLATVRNRLLGFVFQSFNLLPRTSAVDNVALPLHYAGVARREARQRAAAALHRVGLGERLEHKPAQLSGGQMQRVAIARALVTQPQLILADEPTGNLDSRTSIEVIALLQQLGAAGITVVLVTHEPEIAAFASRLVVMRDGKIVEDRRQVAAAALAPRDTARFAALKRPAAMAAGEVAR
jgi:putative ABC transport system ATP-binding protein